MSTNQSKKGGGVFGKSKTERELERKINDLSTQIKNMKENMKKFLYPLINQVSTLEGEVAKLNGFKETHGSTPHDIIKGVTPNHLQQADLAKEAPRGGRKMKKLPKNT